jgi:uncharacterized protein (DUF736 family)
LSQETSQCRSSTFTKSADGAYTGAINTLSLNVKSVAFRVNDKTNPEAPDYRIFAGKVELGAAWKKTSEHRDYLSVKLDDPSFPREIYASLVDADEGYNLIWSRSRSAR